MNPLSTWTDLKNIGVAFLPIGSTEQHGHHLPIYTDSIIAEAVASECAKHFNHAFVCPVLPFSASFEHVHFPGSISLRSTTIIAVVQDIVSSLERMGIKKIVIINGHGGNYLLGNIAQEMNMDHSRLLVTPNRYHWENAYKQAGISSTVSEDMHAGEGETSILMHLLDEGIIKIDQLIDIKSSRRDLLTVYGMKKYTETGAIGFPSRGNSIKGKMLLESLALEISITVKEFLNE
ncbi:creatininase family protein [Thermoactinomyces sp. DSM 45892]|uniref:creatininase family protein n=1 Tax=Thermoactinomyces sp. DSM 45892 TaxID=1882753 RepID=UPI000895BBEA|nr:creatininase family protein [Thermoactinomyces sp. DSM 45892]SDZ38745.1 creatinine amidohydrolase [Thermoactinomyces sp. DSM 45892]